MVKSVVKGMDAVQAILLESYGKTVESFMLSGASKRGLAAWLASIYDERVSMIVPIVVDMFNIHKVLLHIHETYNNEYPEAFKDYQEHGMQDIISSAKFQKMMEILDPLQYLMPDYDQRYSRQFERLEKYVINASGDYFSLPIVQNFISHLYLVMTII